MNRHPLWLGIACLAFNSSLPAASPVDPDLVFERATQAKLVGGDLDEALALYRQVTGSASASRPDVARAWVELGDTYRMMGSPEAEAAYRRVVTDFADQPDQFRRASAVLYAMAETESGEVAMNPATQQTLVENEMPPFSPNFTRTFDFSPDGRWVAVHAPARADRKASHPKLMREIYLRSAQGTEARPLLEDAGSWEFINLPRWSPDGGRLLFTVSSSGEEGGTRRLMRWEAETGETETLSIDQGQFDYRGLEWMPGGDAFVTIGRDGFRVIGLDGATRMHHARAVDHMTRLGGVSPDGAQVLFHRMTKGKEDHGEIDVWALDLSSGKERPVTSEPGFEGWPSWGPDGRWIYYVAGPEGARNVHRVPSAGGAAEAVTAFRNATASYPRVLSRTGDLVFTLSMENETVMIADRPGADDARRLARGGSPMLSANGRKAWFAGSEPDREGIWLIDTAAGGEARRVASGNIALPGIPKSLVSPDDEQIAYGLRHGDVTDLRVAPASGGESRVLFTAPGHRHLIPSWSPDGREIAFSIDGELMVAQVESGEVETVARAADWESWNIEWSPDGKTLAAFAMLEGEPENHLMLIDRATGETRRGTPAAEAGYKELLAWHADGKHISYMYYGNTDGNGSRMLDIESGAITDFANQPEPMWDYIGHWGPDGRYYFLGTVRGAGNLWGLYAQDPASASIDTVRAPADRSVRLPVWSADGSVSAWTEQEEPVRQLWMMTGLD